MDHAGHNSRSQSCAAKQRDDLGRSPSWEKLTRNRFRHRCRAQLPACLPMDAAQNWTETGYDNQDQRRDWFSRKPTPATSPPEPSAGSNASALIWTACCLAPSWNNRRLAKRNKYRAASRMRVRIGNLTDELHHQAARWLVDNFDVILLPTFETSDMARRGARKLRSKSVRSLLTYAHYRFQKFLTWKAWQVGKELVLVNEAYTSKTCSWSGEIIPNLGGRRAVAGSDGVRVDRDINGARGIFLRTLGDTPALRQAAQEYIGNCAVSVS